MKLKGATRDLIHIISRYSNWRAEGIEHSLRDYNVYADPQAWLRFINVALLFLGAAFCVSGIVFFFAYNWQDLHKFLKLGLIELILAATVVFALFCNKNLLLRNVLLSAASLITGVLFAVFGQIYQTGANAYDFFIGWTTFIILWTLVSRFAPLWLLLLALTHITLILYVEQVVTGFSDIALYCLLFVIDAVVLIALSVSRKWKGTTGYVPSWFLKTVAITACAWGTISVVSGIFLKYNSAWYVSIGVVGAAYTAAVLYSLRSRNVFYLFVVPLSTIVIVSAFLLDSAASDPSLMLLIVTAFVISSITALITQILKLNRRWNER